MHCGVVGVVPKTQIRGFMGQWGDITPNRPFLRKPLLLPILYTI